MLSQTFCNQGFVMS